MTEKKSIQSQIAACIGKILRENFGKGPASVYVTLHPPFFIVHIRGFLTPMEKVLLQEKETRRVEDTRDILMQQLIPEICFHLQQIAGIETQDLYFDWNLEKQSGMLLGTINGENSSGKNTWPDELNYDQFNKKIFDLSEQHHKAPASAESFWLNSQMILIEKNGVFVEIEKELINSGFTEMLKTVKRSMEKRIVQEADLEKIIGRPVAESFFDWNFHEDLGYILLVLQRKTF